MKQGEILLNRKFKAIILAVGLGGLVVKKQVQKYLVAHIIDSLIDPKKKESIRTKFIF